ncbi:MAG TPA: RDD family protein [Pyrinomonadaceae bacterium]|nr:RDD family protein [Pyrinomonadaceae bacterium]
MTSETANAKTSTLLEFPGVNRTPLPQWRKDLSERVREIQERRAREAAREAEEAAYRRASQVAVQQDEEMAVAAAAAASQSLGLLPSPEAPPMNPIVAAALRRVERARRSAPPPMPRARASSSGAAAAIAHFAEEQFHQDLLPAVLPENVPPPTPPLVPAKEPTVAETALQMQRAHNLVVVAPKHATAAPESAGVLEPPKQLAAPPKEIEKAPVKGTEKKAPPAVTTAASAASATVVETSVAASVDAPARTPRKVFAGVVDDAMLARRESESSSVSAAPVQENYDDRAPLAARLVANAVDLLLIAFASSPFGAIIELTNGNWGDPRVIGAMAGIICVVAFLYSTISTLLAGRTFGMSLVSLRAVDAETSLQPSTKQAMGRAIVYLVSLALGGLGIIYALFDAEGRTLHDHLSGTVVIRD